MKKIFFNRFQHFWHLVQILKILKKMMTLMAYVFLIFQTAKDVVTEMTEKSCFRRPFDKQHGKRSQTHLKSTRQQPYQIYWSLSRKLSWKNSLFVICKILGLFLNILTADGKYSVLNREILTQPIEMELSKETKTFCQSFSAFLTSSSNFKNLAKNDHPCGLSISENTYCERPS